MVQRPVRAQRSRRVGSTAPSGIAAELSDAHTVSTCVEPESDLPEYTLLDAEVELLRQLVVVYRDGPHLRVSRETCRAVERGGVVDGSSCTRDGDVVNWQVLHAAQCTRALARGAGPELTVLGAKRMHYKAAATYTRIGFHDICVPADRQVLVQVQHVTASVRRALNP